MIEVHGHINHDGKLHIVHRPLLDQWIRDNKNKSIVLRVERKKKKRSVMQNAWYWGVCIPMIQYSLNQLGNDFTAEDTHDAMKAKFNTIEIKVNGVCEEMVQSTTRLTTVEFMAFTDRVMDWAKCFLNIEIPLPNSQATLYTPDTEKNLLLVERV